MPGQLVRGAPLDDLQVAGSSDTVPVDVIEHSQLVAALMDVLRPLSNAHGHSIGFHWVRCTQSSRQLPHF